jgi:hypothetical protein
VSKNQLLPKAKRKVDEFNSHTDSNSQPSTTGVYLVNQSHEGTSQTTTTTTTTTNTVNNNSDNDKNSGSSNNNVDDDKYNYHNNDNINHTKVRETTNKPS